MGKLFEIPLDRSGRRPETQKQIAAIAGPNSAAGTSI